MKGKHPECHFVASAGAAIVNFPLWKASAIAQSGFEVQRAGNGLLARYVEAVRPPYKGVLATVGGMTYARYVIFYGSEYGREWLYKHGVRNSGVLMVAPPLISSSIVQVFNQPLIRSTISLQNPNSPHSTVTEAARHIYQTRGPLALWHGLSAGLFKTVPKYIVAVSVKDYLEEKLPRPDHGDCTRSLVRSAVKAVAAGVAGAALTNPLDVIRNEMFKTDLGLVDTTRRLYNTQGMSFVYRGMGKNLVAVSVPVAVTIFLTDVLLSAVGDAEH